MALNEGSWFWLDWNGLEWRKLVYSQKSKKLPKVPHNSLLWIFEIL
jgi:hypothetical protein